MTKTLQIYEEYGGTHLTSILEEIKSMTGEASVKFEIAFISMSTASPFTLLVGCQSCFDFMPGFPWACNINFPRTLMFS